MSSWHSLDVNKALIELGTDPQKGLGPEDVRARLEKYGPNELKKEKRAGPLGILLGQFKNVLIIILLVATGLSLLVGETVDAIIIAVIVVFSALLGFVQEYRAEKSLEALKKMLSSTITVLRGGEEHEVDSKEIVPGDIMLLEAGDKIPADGRLVEEASLRCDEASLTGESLPAEKSTSALPEATAVADRANMVFTGSAVVYGRAKALIVQTGMSTEFGKIAKEVSYQKTDKTPLEKRTHEIGKWLGIAAVSVCALVVGGEILRKFLTGGVVTIPFVIAMVMFGVSLAVAAVPEAMAAIVTGALAIGMRDMAKRNALVRKMPAVETLGCTTVICSDKTGTITKGEMTIRKLYVSGSYIDVTGAGYEPKGTVSPAEKETVSPPGQGTLSPGNALSMFFHGGILCNDSSLSENGGVWSVKGDPTEAAFIVAAAKAGFNYKDIRLKHPRIGEVPFSSDRKRMATIHLMPSSPATPEGIISFLKGAPEVVFGLCTHIEDGGGAREITEKDREDFLSANSGMASEAMRVLALAYKRLDRDRLDKDSPDRDYKEGYVESGLTFLGLAGMIDPPRPEAVDAVGVCRRVGIKPVMITGDHKLTAVAIAKEVGIFEEGDIAISGEELGAMSDIEFESEVRGISVYARVSPMDKLRIVKAWKAKGEVVAMTGDGVNDAPALKHADIGIAMGITGTEVTKEAADIVLTDDNFATIVKAVERGRWIYDNIKKYLTFLLRCNITEVIVIGGVALVMGPEYLPLLPAAILYVNLATDGLPALALGVSPPEPDIMARPPRNPKESVFSREVRTFILLAVIVECPIFLWAFFSRASLDGPADMEAARTTVFFMFIVVELVIALTFSSLRHSIFKSPPHKWLVAAVLWEFALIAGLVYIPTVREAFGIAMPTAGQLGLIAVFGLMVLAAMEAVKAFLRARSSGNV